MGVAGGPRAAALLRRGLVLVGRAGRQPGTVAPVGSGGLYVDLVTSRLRITEPRLGDRAVEVVGAVARLYANVLVPAGNTVANTITATAFASSPVITANRLAVGDVVVLDVAGVYSTGAVGPTLRLRLKVGATVVADTTAVTCPALMADAGWTMRVLLVVRAVGASGSLECQGFASLATAATAALSVHVPNAAPITIDTTAAQEVTVTAQWGTAAAANTITLRQVVATRASAA